MKDQDTSYWNYQANRRVSLPLGHIEADALVGNFRGAMPSELTQHPATELAIALFKGRQASVLRLYWSNNALAFVFALEDPAVQAWLSERAANPETAIRIVFDDREVLAPI